MERAQGFIYISGILALCLILVKGEGMDITGTVELEGVGPRGSALKANVNLHVAGSSGGNNNGGEKQIPTDCEPLKHRMTDFVFVLDDNWEIVRPILISNGNIVDNPNEIWQWVYRQTGFNFTDGVSRDRLACLFYAGSQEGHTAYKELEPVYEGLQVYYKNGFHLLLAAYDFDFHKMQDVMSVFREFVNWRALTGFPDVPMENLDSQKQLENYFKTWRSRLGRRRKNGSVEPNTRYLIDSVGFPYELDPEFVSKAILNSGSTEELLKELEISTYVYDDMQTVGRPKTVDAMAHLLSRFFMILQELNDIGMLPRY